MAKSYRPRDRGKAIYRVREVKSPIHQEFRGFRIEVATPNMCGRRPFTDIPCPSFDKPYYICYFGSYESWEYINRKWPSIWRALQEMGFTQVQQIQYTPDEEAAVIATEDDDTQVTLLPLPLPETSDNPSPEEDKTKDSSGSEDPSTDGNESKG